MNLMRDETAIERYMQKYADLLKRGVLAGDLIRVYKDCEPVIHEFTGRKHYRIGSDPKVTSSELKRGPEWYVLESAAGGLVAYCDDNLKGGTYVRVVRKFEHSCLIAPTHETPH